MILASFIAVKRKRVFFIQKKNQIHKRTVLYKRFFFNWGSNSQSTHKGSSALIELLGRTNILVVYYSNSFL